MLDDKSEIIAHFIGIFELNVEAARMKIQYQEMQALLSPAPDLGPLLNVTINVTSAYGLGDFMPDLQWRTMPPPPPTDIFHFTIPPAPVYVAPVFFDFLPQFYFNDPFWSQGAVEGDLIFFIPIPSSMANVTVQTNWLQDNDILNLHDFGLDFLHPAAFQETLDALEQYGEDLKVLTTPGMPENEDAIADSAMSMSKTLGGMAEDDLSDSLPGATLHIAHGEDALQLTVNGESADDMPDLGEVSIRFANVEPEEEEDLPNEPQTAEGEEVIVEVNATVDIEPDEAPHEVELGSNVLLNEVRIASDWLDAPVISVMGKVVNATAVSQINVWNDVDLINGEQTPSAMGSTQTFNAFQFLTEDNPRHTPDPENDQPGGGPQHVVIAHLDGNLINYNYVKQFNFADDSDVVSVRFEAADTYYQTGGNFLANGYGVLGLGFHYDMIVVGGDMIDLKFISQTNVMLDSDILHHQGGFGGSLDSSGNLLFNWAAIRNVGTDQTTEMTEAYEQASDAVADGNTDIGSVRNDDAFEHSEVLRVLYVSGSVLDVQIVEQINVLGDADQIAWASETVQSADGADVSITTGQNEVINLAAVTDAGIDSTIYTSEGAYTESFLYQADFISEDDPLQLTNTDALANEAVVFLADGMITPDTDTDDVSINTPPPSETAVDIMQTILA